MDKRRQGFSGSARRQQTSLKFPRHGMSLSVEVLSLVELAQHKNRTIKEKEEA